MRLYLVTTVLLSMVLNSLASRSFLKRDEFPRRLGNAHRQGKARRQMGGSALQERTDQMAPKLIIISLVNLCGQILETAFAK